MTKRGAACARRCLMTVVLLLGCASMAAAKESLEEALTKGRVNLDIRYRYEVVDQDNIAEDAAASTVRLRLGYTTGKYYGLFAMAEFENIEILGGEQFNSTANGRTQYPVVADPEGEELNRLYLGYTPIDMMTFKLGRQRIKLDNDRFIGNVGWRQNEQTFDAFSGQFRFSDEFGLFVGYLNNANRVFGEAHPDLARAELNLSAPLVNVHYQFPLGKLTGYGYFLEQEDFTMSSQQSIGLRFAGSHAWNDDLKCLYTGEYADQSDYEDGAPTIDAAYQFLELGLGVKAFTFKIGYELLEGDGVYAFQTPLATGHAFNGWADQFLTTPLTGLEDTYLSAGATLKGIKLLGVYHDFAPDSGSGDYGTELNLLATKAFKKMYSVGLKYASYEADSDTATLSFPGMAMPRPNVDVEKIWAWLGLKF